MTEIELLPCPFCGGEALIFFDPDKDAATIRCDDCSVETQHDKTKLIIETWNRRTTHHVSDEAVEALAWYGEQARLARLIHSEGDAGRQALADDGGKRARAALAHTGDDNG